MTFYAKKRESTQKSYVLQDTSFPSEGLVQYDYSFSFEFIISSNTFLSAIISFSFPAVAIPA